MQVGYMLPSALLKYLVSNIVIVLMVRCSHSYSVGFHFFLGYYGGVIVAHPGYTVISS